MQTQDLTAIPSPEERPRADQIPAGLRCIGGNHRHEVDVIAKTHCCSEYSVRLFTLHRTRYIKSRTGVKKADLDSAR